MRGFATVSAAAAFLAVPAVAQIYPQDVEGLGSSAAFIILNTEVAPSVEGLLTLRLDIRESENPCDADHVTICGQPLPVPSWGRDELPLRLDDGTIITARWAFACDVTHIGVTPSLILDLTVTEKDGQPLFREASFVAHFRQKDPVEFISVSSPHAVKNVEVYTNVPDGPDLVFKELEVVSEGVSEEIQEIYKYMVPSSEKLPPDLLQGVEDHVADDECDSWTCFVDSVTEDVMETADRLYDEVMAKKLQWHSHSDKPDDTNRHPGETKAEMPNSPQDEEPAQQGQASQGDRQEDRFEVLSNPTANRKMKPITSTDDSTSSMAIVSSPTPTARFMPSLPPPDQDLIMTLTIAIAAFVLFSIVGIIAGTRRLAPHIQRRPRHRETHEERLARVAERRRAFKNFFSGLFCGLFGYEEKMDGQDPQGQDLRDSTAGGTYQQEDDTTMEQELVGLRNAADMVSNLIAAEEGRNNQMLQHHLHQQQQQGGDFPGEAPPPSYENDAVEAIMVADGFQYTPGGTGYSPSSPTDNDGGEQGTSNSDRLGYGNKD